MPPAETVLKAALSCCSASTLCSICPPSLPKMSNHPVEKVRGKSRRGFDYDKKHFLSLYGREWASIEEFQAWLLNEQRIYGIKFFVSESFENMAPLKKRTWLAEHTFHCSRHKPCTPRYVGPPKRIKGNCFCSVTVKTYPNTPIVRGNYLADHSHPLGEANATLSEKLLSYIREKMSPSADKSNVVCSLRDGAESSLHLFPPKSVTNDDAQEYDSRVDAWRPTSALYLDHPDPFASMSMIDVPPRYIYE
ncbi:hypothetical protein DFS33DRAFT_1277713 [Desarmillaria ectypa]|nr:hypothetical protein DFS33DRAFT_1277713 [Desarmillaria ectypa]